LWSEGFSIIGDFLHDASLDLEKNKHSLDHGALILEYIFNGTFHFFQSLVAFTLLSMVSPVTYSVASLIKRVFVICFAIIWFGNNVSGVQGIGIALTFLGLYLYDRTSGHAARTERRQQRLRERPEPLLPVHEVSTPFADQPVFEDSPLGMMKSPHDGFGYSGEGAEAEKRREEHSGTPQRKEENVNGWLAPGTRAEDTWKGPEKVGVPVT
jgi:solute carrier family 35 protein E1